MALEINEYVLFLDRVDREAYVHGARCTVHGARSKHTRMTSTMMASSRGPVIRHDAACWGSARQKGLLAGLMGVLMLNAIILLGSTAQRYISPRTRACPHACAWCRSRSDGTGSSFHAMLICEIIQHTHFFVGFSLTWGTSSFGQAAIPIFTNLGDMAKLLPQLC